MSILNTSSSLSPQVELAFSMAKIAHTGQTRDRDKKIKYFTHCIEVFNNLVEIGKIEKETTLIAGILHDTLEETDLKQDEILLNFGEEVLALILQVTREEPKPHEITGLTKDQIYEVRNLKLLSKLATISKEACELKLADRLSNFRFDATRRSPKSLARYTLQTRQILEIIPESANVNLHRELSKLVSHSG